MPAIEIQAPDVEAAINQGLAQLRLLRAEVKIEVVDEGARGVLGIGARPAKVRMTPYAEVEARTRAAAVTALNAPPKPMEAPPPPPPPPPPPSAAVAPPVVQSAPAPATPAQPPRRPLAPREPQKRQERPERAERRPATPPAEPVEAATDRGERSDATPRVPFAAESIPENAAPLAREIAQGLVERMGLDVAVEAELVAPKASDDEASIYVNVSGPDAELLLSYQGEGLSALQTLTQMMWAHQMKSNLRLTVDADGYKAARERKIMQMARRMADRVAETGRSVTLEPMPANERRFIHLALRDDDRVFTESTGEGARRKVVVKPKEH